jgi:hypothetical protein
MKVDSWDRFETFAWECVRSRKEGREPPKAEFIDVPSWGPIPERLRPMAPQLFAKIRATEQERQQVELDLLREHLDELSKSTSKSLGDEYGIPDYTP